jgi:hypothetical protein
MLGPHITGLDFVAFSIIAATTRQSSRRWSSSIASRKASTLPVVA